MRRVFQLVPLISIAAAAVFFFAKRHYHNDMARLNGAGVEEKAVAAALEVQP